jgi:hypothetical protein
VSGVVDAEKMSQHEIRGAIPQHIGESLRDGSVHRVEIANIEAGQGKAAVKQGGKQLCPGLVPHKSKPPPASCGLPYPRILLNFSRPKILACFYQCR